MSLQFQHAGYLRTVVARSCNIDLGGNEGRGGRVEGEGEGRRGRGAGGRGEDQYSPCILPCHYVYTASIDEISKYPEAGR